eukprot:COSAG01_NODE_3688_length_5795_cov_2.922577_4_plen_66_part_00
MQAYVALGLSKLGTGFLLIFIIVVVTVGRRPSAVIHIDVAVIHGADARPARGTCDCWDRTRAHTS